MNKKILIIVIISIVIIMLGIVTIVLQKNLKNGSVNADVRDFVPREQSINVDLWIQNMCEGVISFK